MGNKTIDIQQTNKKSVIKVTTSRRKVGKSNAQHTERKLRRQKRIIKATTKRKRPKYIDMIMTAFFHVGSSVLSRQAIRRFMLEYYQMNDKRTTSHHLNAALKRCVTNEYLKQIRGQGANGSFALFKRRQKPTNHYVSKPNILLKQSMVTSQTASAVLDIKPLRKKEQNRRSSSTTKGHVVSKLCRTAKGQQYNSPKTSITRRETRVSEVGPPLSDKKMKDTEMTHSPFFYQRSTQSIFDDIKKHSGKHRQISDFSRPLSEIKAVKKNTYDLGPFLGGKRMLTENMSEHSCDGMAITEDGRLIFSDSWYRRVSMFSTQPAMKFLSYVKIPEIPKDLALTGETEVAVCTEKGIVILDITCAKLKIKGTIKLPFDVSGITRDRDDFIVTSSGLPCGDESPVGSTVKLLDRSGTIYWSVCHDQKGPLKYGAPESVCSYINGLSSFVVVSDSIRQSLTLLNGETGSVITRRYLPTKKPFGVTADTAGNVYVCYKNELEISVFNRDLSEEKIIISAKDGISEEPRVITYDGSFKQLFVGHWGKSTIECFKLL